MLHIYNYMLIVFYAIVLTAAVGMIYWDNELLQIYLTSIAMFLILALCGLFATMVFQ